MTTAILALRTLDPAEQDYLVKWAFTLDETIEEELDAWVAFEKASAQDSKKREAIYLKLWADVELARRERESRKSGGAEA
jgi:hypothetical protein